MLPKARRLLHLNDDIWSDMAAAMVGGKVRVGAPYDLVGSVLSPALKGYADAYPQVEISLTCDSSPNLLEVLANGEVDLAVIEEPAANAGDACLTVERLLWVGAKGGGATVTEEGVETLALYRDLQRQVDAVGAMFAEAFSKRLR